SGTGSGADLTHHSKYSTLAHDRSAEWPPNEAGLSTGTSGGNDTVWAGARLTGPSNAASSRTHRRRMGILSRSCPGVADGSIVRTAKREISALVVAIGPRRGKDEASGAGGGKGTRT